MPELNIAIEFVSLFITAILILCYALDREKRTASHRVFLAMLCVNALLLIDDMLSWCLGGLSQYNAFLQFDVSIGYCLGSIMPCLLSHYIASYIPDRRKSVRGFVFVMDAICTVGIILVAVSAFNGMYFTYENGIYEKGELYIVSQLLPIINLLANEVLVLSCAKQLGRRYTFSFLSYGILPTAAIAVQYSLDNIEITYTAATLSLLIIHVMINVEQAKRLQKRETELEKLKTDIMLSQIQPHFLYNALNSITALCDISPFQAKIATQEFSKYLRGNIEAIKEQSPLPFEVELEHIKLYLSLEKMRFDNELNVVYRIETTDFSVPTLTIQPLVENAVKYGVGQKYGGGTVTISTHEVDDFYLITISDDGVGFNPNEKPDDGKTHIGIENVKKRLLQMCGATVTIDSKIDVGTIVTVRVPKVREKRALNLHKLREIVAEYTEMRQR